MIDIFTFLGAVLDFLGGAILLLVDRDGAYIEELDMQYRSTYERDKKMLG